MIATNYDSSTMARSSWDLYPENYLADDTAYGYYYYAETPPRDCPFKKPDTTSLWPAIAEVFNLRCQLLISIMTNVFAATFYRRASFSKSGFIGRVAKRRKGRD